MRWYTCIIVIMDQFGNIQALTYQNTTAKLSDWESIKQKKHSSAEKYLLRRHYIQMYEEQIARIKELELHESNIDLQYMGVSSLTLKALSMFGYSKIISLNMSRNQIDNETIITLSKIPMDNLLYLDIHWNRFDHQAIKHLIKTKLPSLQGLYLNGNDIGLSGLKTLLLCPWNLLELGLSNAIFSDEATVNKSELGFPACEFHFSDYNITCIQMSEPLNESWGELASFIMHKNSVDIGALNRLFLLATQTHQEEALFSRQIENFIETISAQAKSKPLQHSQALALISLDALLYNMYKVVRGNEGFKPASSSFYGYMSMSHMSGEFSELSNLNERQPKRIIALVQHISNSDPVSRKVKLILDRANNKERNRRYGENLIETLEYILTKQKCNKENFIKLWSKLVINSGPSKGKTAFDYRRVNEIIFSNQLNKITRLLTEGSDELHFALIRIYYAENEQGERKQFQGREYCGNDMLHNLQRYYVDSFQDQNDLFEESKHPLFRFIRNYLILYFCPFLQKFHAMVVRFGLKGDVEQAWTFYKSNQAQLKEEVTNLIRGMPVELVKLLHSLSSMIEEAFRIQKQTSVNLVKKLLFYSFLCSQSVIEDILPQVDPSKYSNIYNHVLNLFFQSSLRKFADLPPQKLHLISNLVEEISSQTDARIINPNNQVLEEELSEPTELCFSIKDPILNYDYQLIWNAQEKIEFTPKDMKKFAMSKEGERVVESPVYKHFRKEASILEQTEEGEADIATWMSIGGSRDWNNTKELKRDRRSVRERLQGLNTLRGDKIRELNQLKSQFQYYLP